MKKSVKALIIIAAVFLVLAVVLAILSPGRRRITEEVRSLSGSGFIELSEGWTEYEIAGPVDGKPLIMIHGFSVPMYDWDFQFKTFAEAGYRVVRYNHYGRGLSDRPRDDYDTNRYTRQVKDLMDSQGWDKADLMVHSMGGAIASEFVSTFPEAVDRLILIAPVLYMAEDNGGVSLIRIPVIGDLAASAALMGIISSRAEGLFTVSGVPDPEGYLQAFNEQGRYFGFIRSVKSLFRNDLMEDKSAAYANIAGPRTLMIWGTQDDSVPRTHIDSIQALVPGLQTEIINGAGHSPNLEVPDRVNALVLDFLARDLTPR